MRKIGALNYNWNQGLFIKQHLDMIVPVVDRTLVVLEQKPLIQYAKEHDCTKKDNSEEIVKNYKGVEWVEGYYEGEFGADYLNRGLKLMQDCDIVIRLDTDMFLTEKDLHRFVDFIRNTDYDCYRLDWAPYVVNYYVTGSGEYGVYDSLEEKQPMAISPKLSFSLGIAYPAENPYTIQWDDFRIHHLRGWRKKFPDGWQESKQAKDLIKEYGEFVQLPDELKKKLCQ